MIRKKYGIHFQSHGNRPALTLKHEYVSNDKNAIGMQIEVLYDIAKILDVNVKDLLIDNDIKKNKK